MLVSALVSVWLSTFWWPGGTQLHPCYTSPSDGEHAFNNLQSPIGKKKTLPNQQYFQIFVGSAGFDLEVQTPVNENILQVYNM